MVIGFHQAVKNYHKQSNICMNFEIDSDAYYSTVTRAWLLDFTKL